MIEQRLENWFVKQSQSSVNFTGNVKKRFESLPVDSSHEEFGQLQIVKSADGVITGMLHCARTNQEAFYIERMKKVLNNPPKYLKRCCAKHR